MGQFHQGFVRAFQAQLAAEKIPNLAVIGSAGPYEVSWASTGRGLTIFGHFVREGLKGAAAREGINRINALDLYTYVQKNVKDWVWQNRAAVQEPVLLYGDKAEMKEWQLLRHDGNTATPNTQQEPDFSRLETAWKQCDRLRRDVPSPAVYSPHVWRKYLDSLLRAEQIVRAGRTADSHLGKFADLAGEIAKARNVSADRSSLGLTLTIPAAFSRRHRRCFHMDKADRRTLARWQAGERGQKGQLRQDPYGPAERAAGDLGLPACAPAADQTHSGQDRSGA